MSYLKSAFDGLAGSIGLTSTALAGIMIITTVVAAINAYNKAQEEMMREAAEAADEFAEQKSSLEDYITQIEELRDKLDSGSLSEEEAYDTKQQLLTIQQSLAESYGAYAEGIDLVNGKLDEQIRKVQQLTQVEAEHYLNENKEEIEKGEKIYEGNITDGKNSDSYYIGSYVDARARLDERVSETYTDDWLELYSKEQLREFYINSLTSDEQEEVRSLLAEQEALESSISAWEDYIEIRDNGLTLEMYLKANPRDAYNIMNDVMTNIRDAYGGDIEDSLTLDGMLNYMSAALKVASATMESDAYKVYEQALEAMFITDKDIYGDDADDATKHTASEWYDAYEKAIEDYNDAVLKGEDFSVQEANLNAIEESIANLVATNENFAKYGDIFDILASGKMDASTLKLQQLAEGTAEAVNEAEQAVQDYSGMLKEFGMTETQFKDAFFFDEENAKEGTEAVKGLVEAALEAGIITETSEEQISSLASVLATSGVLIGDTAESIVESADSISSSLETISESSQSFVSGLEAVQSVLSSQQGGKSISYDDFISDDLADYQSALENNNGTLQLNAEKVQAIAEAKAEEQVATIETNKALAQYQYLLNMRQIEKYRKELQNMNSEQDEAAESIQASIDALVAENSSIADTCAQYDVLSASIQEAVSAYQNWLNAQNSSDYGDMADDVVSALQRIQDTYDSESDLYGQFGSKKFDAAVELAVPDSVDKDDINAINAWKEDFNQYLNFDDSGNIKSLNIDQFLNNAVEAGLMSVEENADGSQTFNILGQKSMEDFVDGMNMSAGMIQAFFDELQLYDGNFEWDSGTVGDMLVEAGEAANALWDKNADLKIVTDVSDFDDVNKAVETLDATISEMKDVREGKLFDVDTSDIENANSVIEYCVAQKQLLTAPAVMSVDTSQVTGDLGTALSLLQQFQNIQNQIELAVAVDADADTSGLQSQLDSVTAEIQQQSPEILAKIGLDSNSTQADIQTAINNLGADAIVELGVDTSLVTAAQEDDYSTTATVTYEVNKAAVVAFMNSNLNKTATVTWVNKYSGSSAGSSAGASMAGGTAYASGTARAKGDWGTAPGGKTMVGELGTEIYVDPHTGKWYTVGDNGAEFVNLPKDAIVFNHLQTKSLLKNGHTGSRGKALASGNAMASVAAKVTGGSTSKSLNTIVKSVTSVLSNAISKSTSKASGETNVSGTITRYNTTTKSTTSSSGSGSGSSGGSSSSTDEEEDDTEIIDWIEVAIDRIEQAIDNLSAIADSAFHTLSERLGATDDEISKVISEISIQKAGYERYMQEANSVGLSSDLAALVQSGAIDIAEYDEETADLISQYQEWYEKALDCNSAVIELNETLSELYQDKFDNVADDYENQLSLLEHLTNTYNNSISDIETRGYLATTKYYEALQSAESQSIAIQKQELNDLIEKMSEAVNSGTVKEGSEAWLISATMLGNEHHNKLFNCWNTLKLIMPQRSDEICVNVMAVKTERNL